MKKVKFLDPILSFPAFDIAFSISPAFKFFHPAPFLLN